MEPALRLPQHPPSLSGPRLNLNALKSEHAAQLQALAGDFVIADTTLNIPHPYSLKQAQRWITEQAQAYNEARALSLGLWRKASLPSQELLGVCGLRLNLTHAHGELGYWVGHPFWNHGYATEAARLMLDYAFTQLGLRRVFAYYMLRNPSSLQVLSKLGMRQEGVLRQHTLKWGMFEDVGICALLASEWHPLVPEKTE